MIEEFLKVKWLLALMIISCMLMAYTGMTGWRLLGSSAEKWAPEGYGVHNHK